MRRELINCFFPEDSWFFLFCIENYTLPKTIVNYSLLNIPARSFVLLKQLFALLKYCPFKTTVLLFQAPAECEIDRGR